MASGTFQKKASVEVDIEQGTKNKRLKFSCLKLLHETIGYYLIGLKAKRIEI